MKYNHYFGNNYVKIMFLYKNIFVVHHFPLNLTSPHSLIPQINNNKPTFSFSFPKYKYVSVSN